MRISENRNSESEEVSIGFAEWLWPVPNEIKTLYFVLTSFLIIIVLMWRTWYEVFAADNKTGVGGIAIEVISFSPAAGFISMFAMSVFLAGVMTMLEMIRKSMYKQGVIAGEARSKEREARGEARGEVRGEERGRAIALSESAAWYQRKMHAEERGEPFDEPPPWERNGSGPTH